MSGRRSRIRKRAQWQRRVAGATAAFGLVVAAGCSSGGHPAPSTGATPPSFPVTPGTVGKLAAAPIGAKWDWARFQQFTPYLHRLPGAFTFYEVVWCDVEPRQGSIDWSQLDNIVTNTSKLGDQIGFKIRVGSCWATGGRGTHVRGSKGKTESLPPRDMSAYASFVSAVVKRYAPAGVHEYAVENEVNSASMWGGSTAQLVQLVTAAAGAIRAADPRAVVVDPGISSTAYGDGIASWLLAQHRDADAVAAYNSYYARRFGTRGAQLQPVHDAGGLRAALQNAQAQRNLAYLATVRELAQNKVVDVRQLHFYEQWSSVPMLLAYVHAQIPQGMPVEAWELGMFWPNHSDDLAAEADEATRSATLMLAGGVRRVVWLPLAFDPGGRHAGEPRVGLLDPSGATRPAATAFAALSAAATGATAQPVQTPTLTGVAFGRGSQTTLVTWTRSGVAEIHVPAGSRSEPVSAGSTPAPSPGVVRISAAPVLLVIPQPAATVMRDLP